MVTGMCMISVIFFTVMLQAIVVADCCHMEDRSQFRYLEGNHLLHHEQGVACVPLHFQHILQGVGVCQVLVIPRLDDPHVSYTSEEPSSMPAVCMLHK